MINSDKYSQSLSSNLLSIVFPNISICCSSKSFLIGLGKSNSCNSLLCNCCNVDLASVSSCSPGIYPSSPGCGIWNHPWIDNLCLSTLTSSTSWNDNPGCTVKNAIWLNCGTNLALKSVFGTLGTIAGNNLNAPP